jgi:hypothetical protein
MDRVPRGFDLIIEARMRGANRVRMVVPTPYALKGEASPVKLHLIS